MSLHLIDKEHREKLLVLSTLWTTFAGAFLLVISANF
jgi:hypothetical protein